MQLDDVMGTATAVAGRVGEQSRIFENIGNKVLAVGAKFPAINGIINAVRRKKSKVRLLRLLIDVLHLSHISNTKNMTSDLAAGHNHSGLCHLIVYGIYSYLLDQQALTLHYQHKQTLAIRCQAPNRQTD